MILLLELMLVVSTLTYGDDDVYFQVEGWEFRHRDFLAGQPDEACRVWLVARTRMNWIFQGGPCIIEVLFVERKGEVR
jgi:hypothetical protein